MLTWLLVNEVEALDCRFIFTFTTTLPPMNAPENMPEGIKFALGNVRVKLRRVRRGVSWGGQGKTGVRHRPRRVRRGG